MNGSVLVYVLEGSFALAILGFVWKISYDNSRGVQTIFRRFDEYKEVVKKDHVSKETCKIVRDNLTEDIKEIKQDVKLLLRNNGHK